jgi:hypothetical protein
LRLWTVALTGILYALVLSHCLKGKTENKTVKAGPELIKTIPVLKVLLIPSYVFLCSAFFAICAMLWILYTWLPDFLHSKFNLPLASAGLVATSDVQGSTVIGLFGGAAIGDRLMDRTKRGRLYVIIGLSICSPFFYLAQSDSLEHVKMAAVGYGLFKGLFSANFLASVVDILSRAKHSFGVDFCNMVGSVAGGVSAYLVGLLKAYFAVEWLFGFAAGLGLIASILLGLALWLFFPTDYDQAHSESWSP